MGNTIAIVGAGPAGSSLAIRLAIHGYNVTLVERERFPREKLCGEFISPECFTHFRELGVAEEMFAAGGEQIVETVFYSKGGRSAAVPSSWFAGAYTALGLSRATMDNKLLEKAVTAGVTVYTNISPSSLTFENGRAAAMRLKGPAGERSIDADLFVDATGRAQVLFKLAGRALGQKTERRKTLDLVAFKAHMKGTAGRRGRCEIYSFPQGYGGLNFVENGLANLCFIARAEAVRGLGSEPEAVIEKLVKQNRRAAATLKHAAPVHDWKAVAISGFGQKRLQAALNIFSVGDAAAFIDPFTGSGMLMALESSELLARCIKRSCPDMNTLARDYQNSFHQKFSRRLAFSRLIRHSAYRPAAAALLISALSLNRRIGRLVAQGTRQAETPHQKYP